MLPIEEEPPAPDAEEAGSEAILLVVDVLEVDVLEEADAAAPEADEVPLEEPTTSFESVDAVSQAASKIVATHIVKRRFIMEVPIQIR